MLLNGHQQQQQEKLIVEIRVISAEGLKNTCSALFSHSLRPFVSITTVPPAPCGGGNYHSHVYQTRVDDSEGGVNPRWGDTFRVPVDTTFFANGYSCIYLQLYTKGLISGKAHQLGWCQIPVSDMGFPPVGGSLRHLSYRLRAKDGSRGHGIVNISVKLGTAAGSVGLELGRCQTVIGIPVTVLPCTGN